MNTIEILNKQIEAHAASMATLMERIKEEENKPQDVFDDGTILFFAKKYRGLGNVYNFCALKAGRRWYVTGRPIGSDPRRPWSTWDELVNFWTSNGELVDGVWFAPTLEQIIP